MFKFENNLPEYWVNESRDFQLLARLDDILYMGQRADIATIQNLNSSQKCKNTFLNLLAKKVGFFTNEYIEDKVLRNIIGAFRLAVKHKGTKQGIIYAVTAVLKAEKSTGTPRVDILFEDDSYIINIYTPVNIVNKVALKEFLKYILPTGVTYNIYSYVHDVPEQVTELSTSSVVRYVKYDGSKDDGTEDKHLWTGSVVSDSLDGINNIFASDYYLAEMYGSAVNDGAIISSDLSNTDIESTPENITGNSGVSYDDDNNYVTDGGQNTITIETE